MASAERALLPLHPRPTALLSSIHSHQHLNSSSHSHSPMPISLTNSLRPSFFSSHSLEKRVSHRRKPITILCKIRRLPARDMVIDFGRHRGKMMGTLPSKYLRWMGKDPRELPTDRDWATLAKEVLRDPFYRDRMEWETVQDPNGYDYLRLATRFGWDLTASWKDVNFKLLGTSKSGRIPRTKDNPNPNLRHDYYLQENVIIGSLARSLASGNTKDKNLVAGNSEDKVKYGDGDENGYSAELRKRREGRRERQKAKGIGNMRPQPQLEQTPKNGPIFPGRGALLRKLAEAEDNANTRKWPKM